MAGHRNSSKSEWEAEWVVDLLYPHRKQQTVQNIIHPVQGARGTGRACQGLSPCEGHCFSIKGQGRRQTITPGPILLAEQLNQQLGLLVPHLGFRIQVGRISRDHYLHGPSFCGNHTHGDTPQPGR